MKTFQRQPHVQNFNSIFGQQPQVAASAPGRVNLMGDHTDYNGGYVLPIAITQRTHAQLALRHDNAVHIWSSGYSKTQLAMYTLGREIPVKKWVDYIQGITFVLAHAGHNISGFELKLTTDIPIGSGLSSSAALEISILRGLRELFNLPLSDLDLARLGQKAETDFVGAPVGIMDQMASSIADEHHALFINTRTCVFERIGIPGNLELAVIDSGIKHSHATGGYKQRRKECDEALSMLNIDFLTDLSSEYAEHNELPAPYNLRVKHVACENQRVIDTVEAFKNNDLPQLRQLFYDSHASLKNAYQVSIAEIDFMVDASKKDKNIIGARLTGGGFGGSIVVLAHKGKAKASAAGLIKQSEGKFKSKPRLIYVGP